MKTSLAHVLVSVQMFGACAELIIRRLTEGQSFSLSCSPQQDLSTVAGVYLYHRTAQTQTTLLSMADEGEVRVDPQRGQRLQLSGGMNSPKVNVTISHLECSDTGLYIWELSSKWENNSNHIVLSPHTVFLLVEAAGKSGKCSSSYPLLLMTIFSAAGFLLLILTWLLRDKCVKARRHQRPQPHVPIYEEMSWKQQSPGRAQNNHEPSSHLEEVHFPVYTNPNRTQQDNYYACPRQLAAHSPLNHTPTR